MLFENQLEASHYSTHKIQDYDIQFLESFDNIYFANLILSKHKITKVPLDLKGFLQSRKRFKNLSQNMGTSDIVLLLGTLLL